MLVVIRISDLKQYNELYDCFGNKDYCCVEHIIYDYIDKAHYLLINFYHSHDLRDKLEGFNYQFIHELSHLYTPYGINRQNSTYISEREYITHITFAQ